MRLFIAFAGFCAGGIAICAVIAEAARQIQMVVSSPAYQSLCVSNERPSAEWFLIGLGYKNVMLTGDTTFRCGPDDTWSVSFTALVPNGGDVSGTVCGQMLGEEIAWHVRTN